MTDLELFFEQTTEQEQDSRIARLLAHNQAVRDHWQLVSAIKQALQAEDYIDAAMLWNATAEAVKDALWVAPTKGGIFTTEERAKLKSNDMHNATQDQFNQVRTV
jgi:hypothetical protein